MATSQWQGREPLTTAKGSSDEQLEEKTQTAEQDIVRERCLLRGQGAQHRQKLFPGIFLRALILHHK
jgi:hypothetical protein